MREFKILKTLLFLAVICFILVTSLFAQDISVTVKVISSNQLEIVGKFKEESVSLTNWSFLQEYADASNLAERIQNIELSDDKAEKINFKKFNSGEYVAERKPTFFKYQVNLIPSKKMTDSAHTSWLNENGGILMLADLLPEFNSENILVDFELPKDFKIAHPYPLLEKIEPTGFRIEDGVFLVGRNWREREIKFTDKDKTSIVRLAIVENYWQFSDDEAAEMTKSIVEEYRKIFGQLPNPLSQIILSPFPQENSNPDRWRAETRGSTVTIISGSLPYKSQAIQRLHEQLRHEIFHLWLPNSLALSGNYDWFYEGFTIYHALRSGVELNQIRFEDFLNTLGKAYDLSEGQTDSLIQASNKRWSGGGNFVYAKGLVVAFLCDAMILQATKGKKNLKEVFSQIYQKHKIPNQLQDGNSAIISILRSFPEIQPIVQNYIEGKSKISWENSLALFGIEQEKSNFGVQLRVSEKLNGRQKDLLDKLGYNQWRKILQKTK